MQVKNKRAYFNYAVLEEFEAGVSLTGAEAKAAKAGRIDLTQAHARVIGGEAVIINMILLGPNVTIPGRTRKLLLHKKQIYSITTKMKAKKLTLVPIKVYTKGRLVKLKLGLGKAKKKYEKKEFLKERAATRQIEKELRGRY